MRVVIIALCALLSAGGTARAQLADAVQVETGRVKGTLEDGLKALDEYFAWRRTTASAMSGTR